MNEIVLYAKFSEIWSKCTIHVDKIEHYLNNETAGIIELMSKQQRPTRIICGTSLVGLII